MLHRARAAWVDITWVVFIGLNLLAMRLIPAWQTVPFLIIWVTLTAAYGFRLWKLGSTILTVVIVTLATGGLIGYQVLRGKQDADYLAEVPLLAILFVVMVWHSRRRMAAMTEMKRVSEHNLRLLAQQRQFFSDKICRINQFCTSIYDPPPRPCSRGAGAGALSPLLQIPVLIH